MSTRYLVAALLMASACAAQADVLPTVQSTDSANLVKSLGEANLSTAPAQGTYVVGTSNAVMATMLGNSFSMLKLAVKGDQTAGTIGSVATPVVSAPSTPAPAASTPVETITSPELGSATPVLGDAPVEATPAPAAGDGTVTSPTGPIVSSPLADAPVLDAADVPEPSSIALMMAGMMGALAIGRRRAR